MDIIWRNNPAEMPQTKSGGDATDKIRRKIHRHNPPDSPHNSPWRRHMVKLPKKVQYQDKITRVHRQRRL